ncbi:unnamed protein product [Clavelina lepadiformis]|uniref:Homeobox domain-containing protein n=1 Tax=Clavelina lepadiformis TaxID=159417 RepID=A0ABP0FMM8_CLALP
MSKETNYNRNIGIQFSNDVEMGLEEAFRNNETISFALMAALAQKYNLMFIQVDGWFESRKRKVRKRRIGYGRQKHDNANVLEEYAWSNTSAVNLPQQAGNGLTYRQRNTTRNTLPQRSYHATNLVASYHDRRHKRSQLKSPAVTSTSSMAEATQVEQKDRKRRSNYFPKETVQALFGEYRRNPILDQQRTQILAQRYDMTEFEVRNWFHKPWSKRRMAMPFRRNDTMNYFRAGAAMSSLNIPPNPIIGRHETAAPFTSYHEPYFTAYTQAHRVSTTPACTSGNNPRDKRRTSMSFSPRTHNPHQPGISGVRSLGAHGFDQHQMNRCSDQTQCKLPRLRNATQLAQGERNVRLPFNEFHQYNQPGPSGYGNVSRLPQEGSVERQPYSSNFDEIYEQHNQPGPSGYGNASRHPQEGSVKRQPYSSNFDEFYEQHNQPGPSGYGNASRHPQEGSVERQPYSSNFDEFYEQHNHPGLSGYGNASRHPQEGSVERQPYSSNFDDFYEQHNQPGPSGYGNASRHPQEGSVENQLYSSSFDDFYEQYNHPGPSGYGNVSRHPQEGSVERQPYSSNFDEFYEQHNHPGLSGYGNVSRHPQEGSVENQFYSSIFDEFYEQHNHPGPSGYGYVSRHPQEGSVERQPYSSSFNDFYEQHNQPDPSGYGNVSRHPQEGSVERQPYSSNFKEFLDRYSQPGPSGRFRGSHFSDMTGKPYPKAYFNRLEEEFVRNKYPRYKKIEKLSRETGLTIIQIRRWFYHRRRKERLGIGTRSSSSKEQVGIARQYSEGASSRSSAVEQVANVSVKLGRSNFHHSATNVDKNKGCREGDEVDLSKTSGAASNSSQPLVQEVVQNISSNPSSTHHLKTRSSAGNQLSRPSTSFMVSERSWESERGDMDETDYVEEPNIDNESKCNREELSSTPLATPPSSPHTYDSQEDENESKYDREVLQMCMDVARESGGVADYDNEACTSQQSGIVIHDMGLDQPIQSSGSFMLSEPSQDRERLNDSQNSTRNPQEKEENKQSKRHAPSGSSEVTYVVGSPELMGDGFTEDACYSVHKC